MKRWTIGLASLALVAAAALAVPAAGIAAAHGYQPARPCRTCY
jgi:hypothetical protein